MVINFRLYNVYNVCIALMDACDDVWCIVAKVNELISFNGQEAISVL